MAEWILGIETSCDETSAAVLRAEGGHGSLASLVILSQDVHRIFGGVVPELASRAHVQAIGSVVERALTDAGIEQSQLDGVVVTAGPGLVGALLVGVMYGKTLAFSLDRPLLGVNHLEGHLFAPVLEDSELAPPFVGLLVSGGHTMLLDVPEWGRYRLLGQTLDDAAGEAFDKVANLLELGYPGGPRIERLAKEGQPTRFRFPRPMLQDLERGGPNRYAFSFSGLKTAVLRAVRASENLAADRADLARGFQDAALDVLVAKTAHAVETLGYPTAMIGGGVACNRTLAERLAERLAGTARVSVASPRLNTDNAAMIAAAGAWRLHRGERSGWDLEPRDDLPIPGLFPSATTSRIRLMTVYPFIIHLGPLEITGYGLMMMVAFLMGGWLIGLELKRRGLSEDYAADMIAAAVVGGIIGAKLWYVALNQDVDALFSRGGLVWYGGFIGGTIAVILNGWRLGAPLRWTMQLSAPALAAAYALGRVGCFLVNDDYGRPTTMPWGMRFPRGLPPSTAGNMEKLFGIPVPAGTDPASVLAVHPTQLYETAIMLGVFMILWRLRKSSYPIGWIFGLYLVLAGVERFLIEILRAKDDRFLGPFTIAQLTSVVLILIGATILARWKSGSSPAPGEYLLGGKKAR